VQKAKMYLQDPVEVFDQGGSVQDIVNMREADDSGDDGDSED
jgi:hypothetical protein